MKLFVRGDIDGFIGIGLDNVVQLLIAVGLCSEALNFPKALIYDSILPAISLSYLVGNVLYAWLAHQLARRENRCDVCALPYGLHTPIMITYSLLVMLPARNIAIAEGDPDPMKTAWKIGLAACFVSGLVELSIAFVANSIRKVTPSSSMLSALAGVGLVFLGVGFLLQGMVRPLVGLISLMVLLAMFFGRFSFRGGFSSVIVSVAFGAVLCWVTGIAPVGPCPIGQVGFYLPHFALFDLGVLFSPKQLLPYLSIILPLSLISAIGSLQNIESAEAAGDAYPARSALIINGVGTLVGACLGSPFPLTIYIGHTCWKRLGSRAGYSVLNGLFIAGLCLSGSTAVIAWLIPEDAGLPMVIWAGLIVMLQAFETVPSRQWIAVLMGLLPCFGAWISQTVKSVLRNTAAPGDLPGIFSIQTLEKWHQHHLFIDGAFALEQGFVFTATVWASMLFYIVDRRLKMAACWSVVAMFLSLLGMIHSWKFTPSDTVMNMPILDWVGGQSIAPGWAGWVPGWPYAAAYAIIALFLLVAHRWSVRDPETA